MSFNPSRTLFSMMMSDSQMNNEKTREIKSKLAAIGGAVAVVAADITTLIAEFEALQDVPANSDAKEEGKHHVDDVISKDELPVDLSTQKKTKTRGESSGFCDEARPMISELIQTVNCLADALKRNPDQDYADRLFAEVMKTAFFDEDFLVKAFDYLNQYPILARSFISKRPNMRREWLMRSASKWLGNDYMQHSYFKPPGLFGNNSVAMPQSFGAINFGGSAPHSSSNSGMQKSFGASSFGASSAPNSSSNSGGALFGSGGRGQAFGASTPFITSSDRDQIMPLNASGTIE